MDRIDLLPELWGAPEFTLDREHARHLVKSLRARPGDRFLATDGAGREATLEVISIDARDARVRVVEERRVPPGAGASVTLAVAPPKGDRMDVAIEKACEIGVGRIVPVTAARSVVRTAPDSARLERWRRIARSAMVQSAQSYAARIEEPASFDAFLTEVRAPAGDAPPRLLLAHPAPDALSVGAALAGRPASSPIALLIGPEGGFTDDEVDRARLAGAALVSLGSTRLRTETAAVVAAALALEALRRAAS